MTVPDDQPFSSASLSFQQKTLIGALICIGANTLVSLALNVQKLAHQRMAESEGEGENGDDAAGHNTSSDGNHAQRDNGLQQVRSTGYGTTEGPSGQTEANGHEEGDNGNRGPSTKFLRSRLWWVGISLMVTGECGNFISYGFAPASLVAPLGSVALLANVFIAPVLVKEKFAKSDLFGVLLASLGAAGVVAASSTDGGGDDMGNPDELWQAITTTIFLVYAGVMAVIGAALVWFSSTKWGDQYILIDVGACAVFGGFTVLSTKGVSGILSHAASQGQILEALKSPLSYLLLAVLISTALTQIAFLNRALQRFDSRTVIPSQFVFFTISAICGSAVLFRDFERASAGRVMGFAAGCLTTFAGVFVLTREKNGHSHDQEQRQDQEQGQAEQGDAGRGRSYAAAAQAGAKASADGRSSAQPAVVADQERQALLPVTPQRPQRPAAPIQTMTTGSVQPTSSADARMASSSLPTTSYAMVGARAPRVSFAGGGGLGGGGYLLLATPGSAGSSAGLGHLRNKRRPSLSPSPVARRSDLGIPRSLGASGGGVDRSSSSSSGGFLQRPTRQEDATPSKPPTQGKDRPTASASSEGDRNASSGGHQSSSRTPVPRRSSFVDMPAMPLNLPTQFSNPNTAPAESSFRSQLAGFRWAQGSNDDSSRGQAGGGTGAGTDASSASSSYLPAWMSSYVPLHSASQRSNEEEAYLSLSRWERFLGFLACLAGSGVCFLFSFLFLLSPIPRLRKFALSFSMGSMLFMVGFAILSGPVAHFQHVTSRPRLPFTLAYVSTLLLTLYFALGPRLTIPTLIAGAAQVVALLWYGASYFPGGTTTLRYGGSMAARGLGNLLPI